MNLLHSIQSKLILIFLVISAVILLAGIFTYYNREQLSESINGIFQKQIPTIRSIQLARIALEDGSSDLAFGLTVVRSPQIQEVRDAEASFNTNALQYEMYTKALLLGSESEAFKKVNGGILYSAWGRQDDIILGVEAVPANQAEIIKEAEALFEEYYAQGIQALTLKKKLLRTENALSAQERAQTLLELEELTDQIKKKKTQINDLTKELIIAADKQTDTQIATQQQLADSLQFVNTVLPIAASLLAMVLGSIFAQLFFNKPLKKLNDTTEKYASGDLSQRVTI